MPGVFICYRREDIQHAGRLYDHVRARFGAKRVFMDMDIRPGDEYERVIRDRIAACDALIAVIGKNWLSCRDSSGHLRLDNPHDYVRMEIASALQLNVRVIPALVDGAAMPSANDLPENLAPLAGRNAIEISNAMFRPSVERLIQTLKQTVLIESKWKWLLAAGSIAVVTTAGFIVQRNEPIRAELRNEGERIECVIFDLCTTLPLPKPPPPPPPDLKAVTVADSLPIQITPDADVPADGSGAQTPKPPPPDLKAVTVADSLEIQISLDADVPADGSGDQTLSFTVSEDFKAGDTVVIPKGAKVSGMGEVGKKTLLFWGGKMNFRLKQADAVDGQKLNIRATRRHDGKGRASRPFDTGKKPKSKELAADKGTQYIGYTDGAQTLWVRK